MQHTVKKDFTINGIGLHSGAAVSMRIRSAAADKGIAFVRTDVGDRDNIVPARWDHVVDTRLCTVIGNHEGVTVGTIEHLMAALRGCGVDNALIELDGPEVPIMDGSAAPFVEKIDEAGTRVQASPRRALQILKTVEVEENGAMARLSPGPASIYTGMIDFPHPAIGRQDGNVMLVNGNFRHDISSARTFGFAEDVRAMQANGLALGGSLDNAIVLDKQRVMNKTGLRYEDEFIRHKLLDAIGDTYLAGGPIIGLYEGHRPGHAINNKLLHKLFATRDAWKKADLFMEDQAAITAVPAEHYETGRMSSVSIA